MRDPDIAQRTTVAINRRLRAVEQAASGVVAAVEVTSSCCSAGRRDRRGGALARRRPPACRIAAFTGLAARSSEQTKTASREGSRRSLWAVPGDDLATAAQWGVPSVLSDLRTRCGLAS